MTRVIRPWRFWLGASLLVHTGAMGLGVALTAHASTASAPPPHTTLVPFELPAPPPLVAATQGAPHADAPRAAITPSEPDRLGGAVSAQNLSADDPGEHGDGRSPERGQLLAARDEGVNLSPLLMNTLRADQEQRLRTARERMSPQFRRSTPTPGYDPWISLHDGVLLFRARASEDSPARGAATSAGLAVAPGAIAPAPATSHDVEIGIATPTSVPLGGVHRPNAGVAVALGTTPRAAGASASGHASIEQGHASTTAERDGERPSDTTDAEALATTLIRNSIATSVQDGAVRAPGRGGTEGGGAPGSGGGEDRGGHARPYGEGDGWLSLGSPDERYVRYFQLVRRRLDALWADAFPREDALQLRQGTVILRFVIAGDGSVHDVAVQRHSGIDAFDHNVAVAVAGARLPPIPSDLRVAELHITAPFVFRNPVVR